MTKPTNPPSSAHPVNRRAVLAGAGVAAAATLALPSAPAAAFPVGAGVDPYGAALAHQVLRTRAAYARGHTIGTSGRASVAFRLDHHKASVKSKVVPLLQARGIPSGLAVLTDLDGDGQGAGVTWDDLRAWNWRGMEMWSHGIDHTDPRSDPGGPDAGYVKHIVDTKAEIEAEGLFCQGWMQPGISNPDPNFPGPPYDGMFGTEAEVMTQSGWMVLSTYAHLEGDVNGYLRPAHSGVQYGLGHYTIDSATSLATLTAILDRAERYCASVEFMLHATFLDQSGRITTALLTSFLDELVTRRNAGRLEILTPSGLYYADPRSTNRYDAIVHGTFEGQTHDTTAQTIGAWDLVPSTYTLVTNGVGHSGTSYVVCPAETSVIRQIIPANVFTPGQAYEAEAWFRAPNTASQARLIISDHNNQTSPVPITLTPTLGAGSDWTPVRATFTPTLATTQVRIQVGRIGNGGDVWVDDVSVRPV
jgi:hypothetical protein